MIDIKELHIVYLINKRFIADLISKVSSVRGKSLIFWFNKLKGVSQNEMPPFKLEWRMRGYQYVCSVGDLRIISG